MTKLNNAAAFFAYLRNNRMLGPVLTQPEVDGCNQILKAAGEANWPIGWAAYALATAYHETAMTMQPIKEFGGDQYYFRRYDPKGNRPDIARDLGNTEPGDGAKFAGRGYPQVTGRSNYTKADRFLALGGQLIDNPDMMLQSDIAAKVMIAFMERGWFTGKKCSDYMTGVGPQSVGAFTNARRIINGTDRARDIAVYAVEFQDSLSKGAWS